MARHRNIRQFNIDDISNYDDALASSVDDDYAISPGTVDRYMYDPNKQNIHAYFRPSGGSLDLTADDFPINEDNPQDLVFEPIFNGHQATGSNIGQQDDDMFQVDLNEHVIAHPTGLAQPDCMLHTDTVLLSNPMFDQERCIESLEEMDFDSFDQLTSTPLNLSQSKPNHVQTVPSSKITSQFPISSHSTKGFLMQERNLQLLTAIPLHPKPTHITFDDSLSVNKLTHPISPIRKPLIQNAPGKKPSKPLGIFWTHPSRKSSSWSTILGVNSLSVLLRGRMDSVYKNLASDCTEQVKPFRFDTPEPVAFAAQVQTTCKRQLKQYVLPAPRNRIVKTVVQNSPDRLQTPVKFTNLQTNVEANHLANSFAQKLELSASKDVSTPVRLAVPTGSAATSVGKPIDRNCLLMEYQHRHDKSNDKEIINLIVVGHVDAGKSTLMGNLLCQLGYVSNKQLSKYRWEAQKMGKSSFAYAWVLDQTSEERSRGVTMDIAQTSFETKTKRIALLDAPGHKDFVPRVIGGASQADAALLVINATNGEFETGFDHGGQTREHARLVRLLGVTRLIVAVNKMDTVDWDQARFDTIKASLSQFLKTLQISGISFCPVSGLTGGNLVPQTGSNKSTDTAGAAKLATWYNGPTLVQLIDSLPSPERTVDGPFRFVVSDVFKPAGLSMPVVAGRVISGAVSAGVNLATSRVMCQPCMLPASVKSIRSLCSVKSGAEQGEDFLGSNLLDQTIKYAFAGDQAALILQGVDPQQSLVPGDLLTDPDNPLPPTSRIRAKLLVFTVAQPITRGYPVIFYYHSTSVSANISKLCSMTHKENKMEKTVRKPRCLFGSCTADVEITLDRPVCVELYDKCKPLGRFMLRVGGESIAGGTVTAVLPPKHSHLVPISS